MAISYMARSQEKEIKYLSGTDKDHTVAWQFFCTGGRKSGTVDYYTSASCWEQQGFGAHNYGRDYKTYGRNFRFADEKGIVQIQSFTIPANWKKKDIHRL